jgi:serine/threonine protein kinase
MEIGSRIGSYEITSLLGKGGMGEVYLARDTKLKREVAIKVLPDEFLRDADRVGRFQREAEVLASLNHPNIAHIYGLDESSGTRCIVMELVDGETLQERLRRGPIPIDEALPLAKQLTDALEAAHEKGIIHRDLKPANIKCSSDGQLKVLDFGLAKAFLEQRTESLSNSPTLMSVSGVVLGTAAYMSPEQAKGRPAERPSDVWAFGCVLYEVLTGHSVFSGETVGEILVAVHTVEPDWKQLPAATPVSIRRLLRRCLQKDRKERLQHIGDARIEINEAGIASDLDGEPRPNVSGSRQWLSALIAGVLIGAAIVWMVTSRTVTSPPEVRFELATPVTPNPTSIAVSPDGQQIAFLATSNGRPQIWLRSLNSTSSRPLAGTDGGHFPFWSPDSRSIGFFDGSKLKVIDIDGGLVRELANAANAGGGAWNSDGTILFTPNFSGPIFRISTAGGNPAAVTHIEAHQASHRFPKFLPDGRHFLYYVSGDSRTRGVYVGQLDGAATQRLLDADAAAVYASPGYLLFVRQGKLIAQKFDPAKLALSGNPFPIADDLIAVEGEYASSGLSASAAGSIVYRAGQAAGLKRQFVWFDRSGKEIAKVGAVDDSNPHDPSISPDGRRLALARTVNGNTNIWMLDLARGALTRFTFDMAADIAPVWSHDGRSILFSSSRNGIVDLYRKSTTGAGSEELVLTTKQNKGASDWSPDGRFVLYRSPSTATGFDLWVVPMDGERIPVPVVQTNSDERDGQFSPDGKWIAYQSNESGRMEIEVQSFPGPGGKLQVSNNGGAQVRWRPDGKELFYIALDGQLMSVPIRFTNSQNVEADPPIALFPTNIGGAVQGGGFFQYYVVSPDGKQFLMDTLVSEAGNSPITVILNWKPKQ